MLDGYIAFRYIFLLVLHKHCFEFSSIDNGTVSAGSHLVFAQRLDLIMTLIMITAIIERRYIQKKVEFIDFLTFSKQVGDLFDLSIIQYNKAVFCVILRLPKLTFGLFASLNCDINASPYILSSPWHSFVRVEKKFKLTMF